jgi:UDP-N-acetylglucosamine kinase
LNKIKFLKRNKNKLYEIYFSKIKPVEPKIVIFTAGASGAGKTEYAKSRIKKESYLLHLDTDEIREFFRPVGYNGYNSSEYQQVASKGMDILYKKAINKGFSVILDSNFASFNIAKINIEKALNHKYIIEIVYILQDLEKCYEFAKARENITNRVVPKDIIKKSFINSFDTVLKIKEIFTNEINLILIDRINRRTIEDIQVKEFFEIVSKEIL